MFQNNEEWSSSTAYESAGDKFSAFQYVINLDLNKDKSSL